MKESTFLSYSRTDSEFVLKLAKELKAAGAEIWVDKLDIKPGSRWDRSVEMALSEASRMLLVLSQASVDSDNVMDEVNEALESGKSIIPVLINDCKIPFRLKRFQRIDFSGNFDEAFYLLLSALNVENSFMVDRRTPPDTPVIINPNFQKIIDKNSSVKIGTQEWMVRNLDVGTYRNGDPIPEVKDENKWFDITTGAWCWYNNEARNGDIYGRLYNWHAVNDSRGLAPQGWRIPTEVEWRTLLNCLRKNDNYNIFAGLPGGFRNYYGTFSEIEAEGYFWSSSLDINYEGKAESLKLYYEKDKPCIESNVMKRGFSVRCITG